MRALVTGGAGFIGSSLVDRLLAEGHRVDVLDDLSSGSLANLAEARRAGAGSFTFHQIDLRAPEVVELIARRRPEVIFHLAAQTKVPASIEDPIGDASSNILASLSVLEGARSAGTNKVVYAASVSLYGEIDPTDLPVSESSAQQTPQSPYGVSKKAVIDYLGVYRSLYGIEFTALALGNVYGPRQREDGEGGVVAIFAGNLASKRPCTIYGDGSQSRDFVYIDDAVDAFARAAHRGSGLLINIGWGIEVTVNELYTQMAAVAGRRAAAQRRKARPGEIARIALDASRARIHLDWKPWTPLEEGIARTLEAATAEARVAK